MLYIDAPVSATSMEEWVLPDGVSKYKVAVDRLIQLRVFIETADRCLFSSRIFLRIWYSFITLFNCILVECFIYLFLFIYIFISLADAFFSQKLIDCLHVHIIISSELRGSCKENFNYELMVQYINCFCIISVLISLKLFILYQQFCMVLVLNPILYCNLFYEPLFYW